MVRFVDLVARRLPVSRLKKIAAEMQLSEDEEYLLIERCANMKTVDQCVRISPSRQYDIMKRLDTRMYIWIHQALDAKEDSFLTRHERKILERDLNYDRNAKD